MASRHSKVKRRCKADGAVVQSYMCATLSVYNASPVQYGGRYLLCRPFIGERLSVRGKEGYTDVVQYAGSSAAMPLPC